MHQEVGRALRSNIDRPDKIGYAIIAKENPKTEVTHFPEEEILSRLIPISEKLNDVNQTLEAATTAVIEVRKRQRQDDSEEQGSHKISRWEIDYSNTPEMEDDGDQQVYTNSQKRRLTFHGDTQSRKAPRIELADIREDEIGHQSMAI
jgi:hypothetical protein